MIADTAMAIYNLAPHDPYWYRDRAQVGRALDALLDTPLGPLTSYAGIIREAKPAPDRAAIHERIATGQSEVFAIQDAKRPKRMTAVLTIALGALGIDARCYEKELAQRPSAIDDLAAIGIALRNCDVFVGMRLGFVRPVLQSYATYLFDRARPRGTPQHNGLRSGAILDLIDTRFHASGREDADPAEVALAHSELPTSVKRSEQDGLVTLKWVETLRDKSILDPACEAHEDWIDRNLPTRPSRYISSQPG